MIIHKLFNRNPLVISHLTMCLSVSTLLYKQIHFSFFFFYLVLIFSLGNRSFRYPNDFTLTSKNNLEKMNTVSEKKGGWGIRHRQQSYPHRITNSSFGNKSNWEEKAEVSPPVDQPWSLIKEGITELDSMSLSVNPFWPLL